MSKRKKDPLLEALENGRSYTWTIPEGGNLASMRAAVKHEQTITMAPLKNPDDIQVGDMVYVKWHNSHIFHIVGEIKGDRFLIVNSVGKVNGWVDGDAILGRVTEVIDPEPRPIVPEILAQLETAYHMLLKFIQPSQADAQRLLSIVNDLRWYADRIGADRWQIMPRSNKWSFEQNVWRLTKQAKQAAGSTTIDMNALIDAGKRCVGLSSEIIILFESKSK